MSNKEITFIKNPLSVEQIKQQMEQQDGIEANVLVTIQDILQRSEESFEEFLDDLIISLPTTIISNISYKPVGAHDGKIILRVTGYIEDFEDKYEEYLEQVKEKRG